MALQLLSATQLLTALDLITNEVLFRFWNFVSFSEI